MYPETKDFVVVLFTALLAFLVLETVVFASFFCLGQPFDRHLILFTVGFTFGVPLGTIALYGVTSLVDAVRDGRWKKHQ